MTIHGTLLESRHSFRSIRLVMGMVLKVWRAPCVVEFRVRKSKYFASPGFNVEIEGPSELLNLLYSPEAP